MRNCHCRPEQPWAPCRFLLAHPEFPASEVRQWQRGLAHSVGPDVRACVVGARQVSGKTTVAAAIALAVMTQRPGSTIAVLGPSDRAPRTLVSKAKPMVDALKIERNDAVETLEIEVAGRTSRLMALPASPEGIRSLTIALLIIDEARGVKPELVQAALPFVAQSRGAVIVLGTPGAPTGFFYERANDKRYTQHRATVSELLASGELTIERVEAMRADYTYSEWRQEFEGEFIAVEGALFSADGLSDAFNRGEDIESLADYMEGW